MDILLLKVDEKITWQELEGFLGCLDCVRRHGITAKKNDTDRINALLSRLLVLSEISKRTGIPMNKIGFTFGTHGKPYLKDISLQYSVSHTKGAICVGFSQNAEIGVDVECSTRRINPVLYKRALSGAELAAVNTDRDFLKCWVMKEAFLKRLGLGITKDLRGINTLSLPDTAVIDYGDLLIGASGDNASMSTVKEVSLNELLGNFTLINSH